FIDGIIFFVSSFLISRNIINPVHQILQSMKSVDYGEFYEIGTPANSYEFGQLYNGYNKMIRQINQLFAKIIQEQKIIRKSELNMLQAQIKPHFLYNTLDSISSLALSGCNEEVCFLVESLGNYYRNSISKGKEVITVGQEIDIVRNYLKIQKVRYPELFEAQYQVDESCLTYPILKLILQP
ncbi:MAG TPA: sensor histidine kinase, partial [Firmicutes bacterium]|nr:sensor histidine kinase [Bacillota bacterium]